MSRPRLIEIGKFNVCRERPSRDWAKDVDTETPSRLSLISDADPHKIRKGWGLPPQINSMNEKLTMAHTTEINEYGPYPFP